mmetsp:Transcript_69933/g.169258  ORF Transcript_69933/g.169258 Transcript_69933/m.169258 type:complete len:432 (+) Transcript_69933:112-1407(+)
MHAARGRGRKGAPARVRPITSSGSSGSAEHREQQLASTFQIQEEWVYGQPERQQESRDPVGCPVAEGLSCQPLAAFSQPSDADADALNPQACGEFNKLACGAISRQTTCSASGESNFVWTSEGTSRQTTGMFSRQRTEEAIGNASVTGVLSPPRSTEVSGDRAAAFSGASTSQARIGFGREMARGSGQQASQGDGTPPAPPHDSQRGPPPSERWDHHEPAQQESIFHKTRLCRFYDSGRCRRGRACRFAHGRQELRTRPDLQCTKLCPNVLRGERCPFGRHCMYAHSLGQLRELSWQPADQGEPAAAAARPAVRPSCVARRVAPAASTEREACMEVQPYQPKSLPVLHSSALAASSSGCQEVGPAFDAAAIGESESEQGRERSPSPRLDERHYRSLPGLCVQNTFLTTASAESALATPRRAVSAPGRMEGQ